MRKRKARLLFFVCQQKDRDVKEVDLGGGRTVVTAPLCES